MKRFHPMVSARLSVALHPMGAAVLARVRSCCGIGSIHRAARRRQRHSHDCARDGAAGHVRPGKLRLPAWACSARRPALRWRLHHCCSAFSSTVTVQAP